MYPFCFCDWFWYRSIFLTEPLLWFCSWMVTLLYSFYPPPRWSGLTNLANFLAPLKLAILTSELGRDSLTFSSKPVSFYSELNYLIFSNADWDSNLLFPWFLLTEELLVKKLSSFLAAFFLGSMISACEAPNEMCCSCVRLSSIITTWKVLFIIMRNLNNLKSIK